MAQTNLRIMPNGLAVRIIHQRLIKLNYLGLEPADQVAKNAHRHAVSRIGQLDGGVGKYGLLLDPNILKQGDERSHRIGDELFKGSPAETIVSFEPPCELVKLSLAEFDVIILDVRALEELIVPE